MTDDFVKNDNISLYYRLNQDDADLTQNKENYDKLRRFLGNLGVTLSVNNDSLYLAVDPERYHAHMSRNAGRHVKFFPRPEAGSSHMSDAYLYSDIIYMLQTMTDKDVIRVSGIPQSTYYRHKKIMTASSYYLSLDKNRLCDIDYLKSAEGDFYF